MEQRGRMTDSWRPSDSALDFISSSFPHVHSAPVVAQFRLYHQDPSRNVVRSQSEWDRLLTSWCARREEKWLDDHADHTNGGVRFDEVTGMPINPRPQRWASREREKES